MMAVNHQGNCQWKQSRATKECPEQDLPILEPLLAKDPQAYAGAKQGQEVLEVQRVVNPCRLIFSKNSRPSGLLFSDVYIALCRQGLEVGSQWPSHDPTFLDNINLPLEYRARIVIEFHNKTYLHLQPRPLDAFYRFDQITVFILLFIAFSQAFLIRRFDPDKNCIKTLP